jgi:nitrite reductase/ring-hydroxylating ferredoxin subunit
MPFIDIGQIGDVVPGAMKSFPVGEKQVLIANVDGRFYAMNGICTHAGGNLSKGKLEGTVVTCPRHGSRFDITTGKALSGPKIAFLHFNTKDETVYAVRTEGKRIQIDMQ